jgi:hypothetical protein
MTGQTPPRITAIPKTYKGIRFRSTLEADWAWTMDEWRWVWNYEPIALNVLGEAYLPDFYLPNQNVWCEVKGPSNDRLDKAARLSKEIDEDEDDVKRALVVILRPAGNSDYARWEGARPGSEIVLSTCPICENETFVDLEGVWICRICWRGQELGDHSRNWATNYLESGDGKPFYRDTWQSRVA